MQHTRSQCARCKQIFAGTRAFDAHRVGPFTRKQQRRRCLSPREMRLRGMNQTEQGWWMQVHRTRHETSDVEGFTDQTG